MKTNRRSLALTAAAASAVSVGAVAIVSSVPEIAPALAIAGIVTAGGTLAAFVGIARGKTHAALVTFAMFLSLVPLFAIAGEAAMPLWLASWVAIGIASKRLSMQAIVERVTSSRTLA